MTSRAVLPAPGSRRAWTRRVPGVVVGVAGLVVSALAFLHPGVTTAHVDTNDGGIWVTNQSRRMVGHLNYDSRTLDAALRTETSDFDIGQHADTVTFSDREARTVAPVDVSGVRLGAASSMGDRAVAVQGGDRLGILDAGEGLLWAADAAEPSGTALSEDSAVADELVGGVMTVAQDGTVLAVSGASPHFTVLAREGHVDRVTTIDIPGLPVDADLSLTAVGSRPVALDAATNMLYLPDGSALALSDLGVPTGGVLQEPGPEDDAVLLATDDSLVSIPLDGDPVTQTPSSIDQRSGTPARPVRHQGCDYAAWAVSGTYVRVCDDPAVDQSLEVDSLRSADRIQFRTNRTIIVLNDVGTGSVWLPDQDMVLMSDWDQIDSELEAADDQEDSPQVTDEIADPVHQDHNTPPEAVDDDFGVRPGRATTLPVLQNDSDADGDVLTARPLTEPAWGTVARTRGGQALQIDGVEADASGSTSFTYEASDGQAVDTAGVTVTVHPWSHNEGPVQLHERSVSLGYGAEIEDNVLTDWIDPDGDPIFLESATAPPGLQVQFREEGTLTIRDLGAPSGPTSVEVVVSDGRVSTTGTLVVEVQQPGNLPPTANADFLVARVGEPTVIEPLANDTDPNGDVLRLVGVSEAPAGSTLTPDLELGTLTFTAQSAGTYQFGYTATDGPATAVGVVRVDVVEEDQDAVPVAEDDLAVLPQGGSVLVAPLANDSDPAGGVLVVQSLDVPSNLGLEATLVDRHLLRISAPGGLDQAVSFGYTVSNGRHTASAQVTVVPTDAQDDQRPPELQPDRAKVRVGDVASVAVLANDRSPAGLAMNVDPALEYTADPQVGTPFVTGNLVRLEAGDTPGVLHVAYTVRDSAGNMATSTVTFEVVALDGANAAPRPKALTAWSVSGQMTRIPVPVNGIDPDGDSVALVGIEQAPQKGTVELGVDWLEYTPATGTTGTDVFSYIVEDRQGMQATARVRVGIAPPSSVNQPPIAVKDTLLVRPDRRVAVDVLANDLDADGDALSLVPDSLVARDPTVEASVRGNSVVVVTPSQEGSYVLAYSVSDGRGGTADGTLTLNVSPGARLQAPLARDDAVSLARLPADGSPVRVDVLDNDQDEDGDVADLTVASRAPDVTVSGQSLLVTPHETRRLVVYTITDADGLTSSAVVSVPGTTQARPRLDMTSVPVTVRAGQDVTLDITDHVIVRTGRTPQITDASTLRTSVGIDGTATLLDDHRIALHVTEGFSGRTAVSFEVRDGTAADESALSAVLSLPLTVESPENQPPVFTPSPIRVAAGEEPVDVDLAPMVRDPDGADSQGFTYRLVEAPTGLRVTLDGHALSVGAALDQVKGAAGSATVSVDDGSGPVEAQIPVTVVASTRPLIAVSDAVISAANAGGTETVDLTYYTINPFPDTPVRIVGTSVQVGEGTVDPQGTRLLITPAAGFHGQMAVGYRLMDATGDPDRAVQGQVRLVVRDRPEPPTGVSVMATGAGSALVTFQPGSDNGAPLTSFTLTDVTSGQTFSCAVASCPVSGLANGVKHSFTVVAHNDAGSSDPSAASAEVLVDMRPERPGSPTVTAGDGRATVTWTAPRTEGSAITGYTVFVQPTGQTLQVGAPTTTLDLTGLTNGTAYLVSVQAHNNAEEPSETSDPTQVVPFGRPAGPISVRVAAAAGGSGSTARVSVCWDAPGDSNGRAYTRARITVRDGTPVEVDYTGGQACREVDAPARENSHVDVSLRTEGGWSDATGSDFIAATTPVALTAPTVRATGTDNQLRVDGLHTVGGNGFGATLRTQVRIDGGDWVDFAGGALTGLGLSNGTAPTLEFRQVGTNLSGTVEGPAVTVAAPAPYGPVRTPVFTAVSGGYATATLSWDAQDTSGRENVRTTLTVDGSRTGSGATGSATIAGDPGTTITAVLTSADGAETQSTTISVTLAGIEARPAECAGGELPDADEDESTCRTFQVRASQWATTWGGAASVELTGCRYRSDLEDDATRDLTGIRVGTRDWVRSGVRTGLTDAQEITGRLSCTG